MILAQDLQRAIGEILFGWVVRGERWREWTASRADIQAQSEAQMCLTEIRIGQVSQIYVKCNLESFQYAAF